MRILQVSDFYPPNPGGLEAHVARLSEQLASRGHDVTVAAGGQAPAIATAHEPVSVYRLPLSLSRWPVYAGERKFHPPWPDPAFARRLLKVARQHKPDIIHAHGWSEFSAVRVGRQLDVPVIVTLHDYGLCCPARTLSCEGQPCRRTLGLCCLTCARCEQGVLCRAGLAAAIRLGRRRLARGVAQYLAVSEYVARAHLALGVGDSETLRVVPNFVNDMGGLPGPPPHDGPILFVGPAASYKGWAVLERAYATLAPGNRPRLWVVGEDHVTSRSADVDYLGRLSGPELSAILQASSIAVVPPLWHDPCPTVALEASAAARPVVASAVGGLTDIVVPGVTGLLIPANDHRALAGALGALIRDKPMAARLGQGGRKRVAQHYSSSAIIPRVEQVYEESVA